MDYFSLVFTCLCLTGQGILHIAFVSRLTGKGMNIRCFVLYLLLIDSLEWFGFRFAIPGIFAIPAQLLVLYGMNRFVLRNRGEVSRVAAVLAIYISQLSFGVANSVEAVVFPYVVGKPLLYLLILLAMLASFILCICCYMAALRFLSLAEGTHTPYLDGLLFPGLFFFAAELYILHTSYSSLSLSHSLPEAGKHSALLFLQILGLAALLGTLYVYRCLCHSLQAQAALQSAAQAARVQKIYIAEA
ncbi:MAG TPA: GHKL domain-containing protein, partial [Lachnospiraceae bacterium]|nr:GHKL domain-containing protein [Lachnospiraceae bacterium]